MSAPESQDHWHSNLVNLFFFVIFLHSQDLQNARIVEFMVFGQSCVGANMQPCSRYLDSYGLDAPGSPPEVLALQTCCAPQLTGI
jgi:hypothetical protein